MLGQTRTLLINTTSFLIITLLSFVFLAATPAGFPGNMHSVTHAEALMALAWQPTTFTEVKKLTHSSAYFSTVAVSDSTLVIGAGAGPGPGAAFVYQRIDGIGENWDAVKTLRPANGTAWDQFGYLLIGIDGDMSVVGALGDDNHKGAAYIFERNAGGGDNWGRTKRLTAPQRVQNDQFGTSAAISGDTVVVGSNSAVYIFERNNGGVDNWGFVKKLDHDLSTVAIDGNTIVAGGGFSDHVDIYQRNNGGSNNWGKVKTLHPANGTSMHGFSLAISGNTVVIGDYRSGAFVGGSAHIYMRDQGGDNNWGLVKTLHASDSRQYDAFGYSVAIAGNTIVVGAAVGDPIIIHAAADAAYVFKRNHGGADNWGEIQKLIGSDSPAQFGSTVATTGGRVFVSGGGAVYIFATPLDIAARTVSIDLGSPFTNTRIGRVQDANQPFNTLLVTVNDGTSVTVNAVTVSNITVNANGAVFANIAAHFGATNADFTLKVTNSLGEIDTATLRVEITQP